MYASERREYEMELKRTELLVASNAFSCGFVIARFVIGLRMCGQKLVRLYFVPLVSLMLIEIENCGTHPR